MNVTTTMHSNLYNDIKIAKEAGYQGIELQHQKYYRYLDLGLPLEDVKDWLNGIEVSAIGALWDIERQRSERVEFLREVERMCKFGRFIGTTMVQMCTGPVDVEVVKDFNAKKNLEKDKRYKGFLGRPLKEAIEGTVRNVAAAADIAREYGMDLFLEPVAWTPINTLEKSLEVISTAGKDNIGLVIDFWHMWVAGDKPEDISKLDKNIIKNVHICDGLEFDRNQIPDQAILRDVWTGAGSIPLKEWIDAVKATGYDGWYTGEIFCKKAHEYDYLKTALALKYFMEFLLI